MINPNNLTVGDFHDMPIIEDKKGNPLTPKQVREVLALAATAYDILHPENKKANHA